MSMTIHRNFTGTRPSTTNSSTIPSNEAAFALDQLSQLPIMHRIKVRESKIEVWKYLIY